MTKKTAKNTSAKGLKIGAAMKQRMGTQDNDSLPATPATKPATKQSAESLEPFNTRLPSGLYRRLKVQAATEGRTIQDIVSEALTAYLSKADRE